MRPTGLVLCGGEGRRLGGTDKPLQEFAGRPLIESVLERLAPQVGALFVSANRHSADYARYGHPVIDDGTHAGHGPLAGLLAGLVAAQSDDVLCVPGDAPALPVDLASRLARHRGHAGIAYVHDGAGPQPLCCLVGTRLRDDLRAYLDAGGSTPREWFARHAAVAVDFAEVPRWAWSLNTADEWRAAERLASANAGTVEASP